MIANLVIFASGVILGMLVLSMIKKQKMKRRFDIENQMLRDQAEILRLQKRVADIESEKRQLLSYVESANLQKTPIKAVAS